MADVYFGDNLDVLRNEIADNSIDLIYLDPPFNSQSKYNILFRTPEADRETAQAEAFRDTWTWGDSARDSYYNIMKHGGAVAEIIRGLHSALQHSDMMAYLVMMTERLIELKRVLKDEGSIFLHCDPTASHYLKVVMDSVFGHNRFANEIVWSYRRWPTKAQQFQRMHDVILYYKAGEGSPFNVLYQEATESSQKRWKGQKQRALFDDHGRRLPTIEEAEMSLGVPLDDVWKISIIAPSAKERLGYPTQKPLKLLERIVQAASNKGEVVLDPFCGCGTTAHAAWSLGRKFVGIDISIYAVRLIQRRIKDNLNVELSVSGIPRDFAGANALAERDKYQFQWWVNDYLGVDTYRERRKGPDGGIDGQIYFLNGPRPIGKLITSVKGGTNIGVSMVRELQSVMQRDKAEMGLLVTLHEPKRTMITEAARHGVHEIGSRTYPRIQIISVSEMLEGRMPALPELLREHEPLAFSRKPKKAPGQSKQGEFLFGFGNGAKVEGGEVTHINPRPRSFALG